MSCVLALGKVAAIVASLSIPLSVERQSSWWGKAPGTSVAQKLSLLKISSNSLSRSTDSLRRLYFFGLFGLRQALGELGMSPNHETSGMRDFWHEAAKGELLRTGANARLALVKLSDSGVMLANWRRLCQIEAPVACEALFEELESCDKTLPRAIVESSLPTDTNYTS